MNTTATVNVVFAVLGLAFLVVGPLNLAEFFSEVAAVLLR